MLGLAGSLGLILGSFAGMASYRWPRGESWGGRSWCPVCRRNLRAYELIPVISYLWQRGCCRRCGTKISPRYAAIELLMMLMTMAAATRFGITWSSGLAIILALQLVILIAIDLEFFIIPDLLNGLIGITGLWWRWQTTQQVAALGYGLLAGLILALLFLVAGWLTARLTRKNSLGLGDVKFVLAAGPWLGLANVPWLLIISAAIGFVFFAGWRLLGARAVDAEDVPREAFPFGPALAAALYICVLFESELQHLLLHS